MEKKKIIVFILCISLIIIIIRFMSSCSFLTGDSSSPKSYSSIEEFEKETGILIYNFYDLEEFVTYSRKTPLKISPNYVAINLNSNNKDEKNYRIENLKNGFHTYQVYHNQYKESSIDMKKDVMENGTLYQYHGYDEAYSSRYFTGVFTKENFYYKISFTNNDLDVSKAEQKMIDYIKLVENIN